MCSYFLELRMKDETVDLTLVVFCSCVLSFFSSNFRFGREQPSLRYDVLQVKAKGESKMRSSLA